MSKTNLIYIAIFLVIASLFIYFLYQHAYNKGRDEFRRNILKEEVKQIEKDIDSSKTEKANKQKVILNQSTETKKESKRLIDALPPVTPTWIESDTMLQDKIDYIITYKPQE